MDTRRTASAGNGVPVGHSGWGLSAFLREVYAGLNRGEFFAVYQPVVDVANEGLDGFEALVRWAHPKHGLLGPDRFIPRLEWSGHLSALTDSVLRSACRAAGSWPWSGGRPLRVRVNVAVHQLGDARLVRQVADALSAGHLEPSRLVLEITEAGPLRNVEVAQMVCRTLRGLGVAIALDDFGAGSCDIARLVLLETDELKIDRGMVNELPADAGHLASVVQILDLAASMRLRATVEGVETADQLRVLVAAGAPLLQGFLFGRPTALRGRADIRALDRRCRAALRLAGPGRVAGSRHRSTRPRAARVLQTA